MKCINCATEIEAHYCPSCGQPANVKRITFRQVFDDIQAKFLGLDNALMRTVIDATIRPAQLFQAVLDGNRRRYIGAGGYLFLMLSLMILLFDIGDVDSKAFFGASYELEIGDDQSRTRQQQFSDSIMTFITDYIRLISFLMLPIYALFSRYIFRKSGLNFIEHIALFCYCHAHPLWLSIGGGLLFAATGYSISAILFPVSIGYSIWFMMDYFRSYRPLRRFIKSVLVQLYSLFMLGLIGGVTAIIYVLATQR